jgi:hypothetical protein
MVRKFQFLFIFKTFFWEHFKKTRFGFILPDGFNLKLLFLLEPKKITFFCVNVENGTTAFCSHIQQRFPSCIFGVNDNVLLRLFRYLYKRFQRAYIKMKVCMCVCVCVSDPVWNSLKGKELGGGQQTKVAPRGGFVR